MNPHPPLHTVLGAPHGVEGYSNYGIVYDIEKKQDYERHLKQQDSGLIRDVFYGYTYQCVEYARRFLVQYYKVAFGDIPCAQDIWHLDSAEDLTQEGVNYHFKSFPNGSAEPPQIGDLIIYPKSEHQRHGHVAVIVNVNLEDKHVDVAEQNYEDHGWECELYSRRLKLDFKDNGYYITNNRIGIKQNDWDLNETIYGWKRVIKNGALNVKL